MENNPDKPGGNKSHSVSPEQVINEVIQSIESLDRQLEKFYEIHGTESQVKHDNRSDFRRKLYSRAVLVRWVS